MRIACIIIAHKEPKQLERLIKKFLHLPYDFYLHIDKKINQDPFDYLAGLPHVHFVKTRIRVRWASYSFLLAVFQTMKEILESETRYDFISLMSGQDYPIKPVTNIYNTLEKNPGRNFICYEEGGVWWTHALSRIRKYHFTNFGFRGRYRIQFFLNALLPSRKFPLPYTLYGGPRAMCMTISSDCAVYILGFFESNKKLRRFIRFTWGPDEFLIPTLIMNSKFKDTVINDNFYYIDWSKGGANPKTFTVEDYDALLSSDKMIARKFDMEKDTEILNLLDRIVDK
jgi:hypothetical protein